MQKIRIGLGLIAILALAACETAGGFGASDDGPFAPGVSSRAATDSVVKSYGTMIVWNCMGSSW